MWAERPERPLLGNRKMSDRCYLSRSLLAALLTFSFVSCGTDAAEGGDPDVTGDGSTDVGETDTDTVDPDVVDPDVVDPDVVDPDVVDPDATDVDDADDTDTGDATDVGPDVVIPENCGDGVVDNDEECDDSNDDDLDECTSACTIAACGDGIVGLQPGAVEETVVIVTNPFGVEGPVCDVGASCAGGACDVADDGTASEHGICQALGYERAVSVVWGGSEGAEADPAPRAGNWGCFDYDCTEGPRPDSDGACGEGRMLVSISCTGFIPEACDDGTNGENPNQCREGCELPVCGDSITDDEFGEDCDDGNDVATDGCNNCLFPSCGDGVVQVGEDCDDANDDDSDECRSDCTFPVCGDGITQPGEECDDGGDNSEIADACRPTCELAGCGDFILDTGEECDDGNTVNNDGCSNGCLTPQCGDGITQVDAGEECDDGNDNDFDACDSSCVAAVCGDGILQAELADINLSFDFESGEIPVEFELTGDAQWFVTDDALGTGSVLQSGDINDSQSTSFSFSTSSSFDAVGTFDWRSSSETCCDDLNVFIDDVFQTRLVNGANWAEATFPLPAGDHVVRFTYEKDGSLTSGDDAAWIDNLTVLTVDGIGEECDEGDANADEADVCRTDCQLPVCGDAITDSDEECDDANSNNVDACSNACTLPICGDGIQQGDEECDAGDANSDTEVDGCRTTCEVAFCLDGIVDTGEECDDGNDDNDDGCSLICRTPGCGDGALQEPEGCDDGNVINDDLCSNVCELPVCGDGIRQGDEDCDDGNDIEDDECNSACVASVCGDGIINISSREDTFASPLIENPFGATGPVCDDGQSCFADVCNYADAPNAPEHGLCQALGYDFTVEIVWGNGEGADSVVMPSVFNWVCTDFVCGPSGNTDSTDNCSAGEMLNTITCFGGGPESCDDGDLNADEADACRTDCSDPTCGDGIVDSGEACDDGNDDNLDACSNICALPVCGDGLVQAGEECDDEDDVDDNECTNACTRPVCGDGILQTDNGELCDDGNDVEDDGCRTTCQIGSCGDAIVDDGEECDDGNILNLDFCTNACTSPVCGDGVVAGDEPCDDGNDDDTDGCVTGCILAVCGDGIVQADAVTYDELYTFDDGLIPLQLEVFGDAMSITEDGLGGNGLVSAPIGNGGVSGVQFRLDGVSAVTVSFDYNLSSEQCCDEVNVRDQDGTLLREFTTQNSWTRAEVDVPAGATFVTIAYEKDGSVAGGTDSARLDNIAILGQPRTELCDDGDANENVADACRTSCVLPRCGDTITDTGEACDDGNDDDTDACVSDCTFPICGDGVTQEGEECDDGDFDDLDYCTGSCALNVCGDGIIQNDPVDLDVLFDFDDGEFPDELTQGESVWTVEAIDGDGGFVLQSGDPTTSTFSYEFENLDEATLRFDYALTSAGFLAPLVVTLDGETILSDNRSFGDVFALNIPAGEHVVLFSYASVSTFDRAIIDNLSLRSVTRIDEQCDDGDANVDEADTCRTDCTLPVCGDGVADTGEVCDDGNLNETDACTSSCELPVCGDGFTQGDEECDDANLNEFDFCTGLCMLNICGDGEVQADDVSPDVLIDFESELPLDVTLQGWTSSEGNASSGGLSSALGVGEASVLTYTFTTLSDAAVSLDYQFIGGGFLGDIEIYLDGSLVINDSFGTWANIGGTVGPGEHTLLIAFVATGGADGAQIDNIRVEALPRIAEQCDDGNDDNTDECSNDCEAQVCGDGIESGAEPCDDGNDVDDDACSDLCVLAICGDGAVQTESVLVPTMFGFEEGFPESFTNGVAFPWELSNDANSGRQAVRSADINDGQRSAFSFDTNETVSSELRFAFRISSESCCDDLNVIVDGVNVLRLVAEPVWTTSQLTLSPGPHTVEFAYEKDFSVSTGEDAAWVDDIEIVPLGTFAEQCDDGNSDDGDGCDSMCMEEG
ncbi:MAG: cysteine-rich repeat protein [Flavobacteriales bacterium]|jgi:cysteine-rich repeat protein